MVHSQQNRDSATVGLAIAASVFIVLLTAIAAQAQTFQVLHNFTGGRDGANPLDGLTIDRDGNLYGTASAGGNQAYGCQNFYGTHGCGAVFELAHAGTGWILRPVYDFPSSSNGYPEYGVAFGPDGALYGVTNGGSCCGGVYRLAPPATICTGFTCNWQQTVLHQFTGQPDASGPSSRVTFDSADNLYGLTFAGGVYNGGVVYELSRNGTGWTENVIYSFGINGSNGEDFPSGQLAIDPAGNLYSSAECNVNMGCFYGEVWELQPSQQGWNESVLFQFNGFNGYAPYSGVIRDSSGNLYGTNSGNTGGGNGSANVYELSPSNGGWNFTSLYDYGDFGEDSTSALTMDSAGNLYGADSITGDGYIFKLTHSGNNWTFSRLHSFSGSDGAGASGQIVIDSAGNLYGTTAAGGAYGYGVIWEITP